MLDAHFRSRLSRFFAGAFLWLTGSGCSWALADGYFDPTWAVTQTSYGRISFTVDATNIASVTSIVLEGNGNVLLNGLVTDYWWLGELFPDGTFVPTFGVSNGSGLTTACELGFYCGSIAGYALGAIPQPDGKYLALSNNYVWRTTTKANAFDTAGVIGGNGYIVDAFTINDAQGSAGGRAMALLSNGKILVAGSGNYTGVSTTPVFGVVRLNSDLSLDTSFNAITDNLGVTFAGGAVISVDSNDSSESVGTVLVQPDGSILLVGSGGGGYPGAKLEAVRLTAGGALDTSFGTGGKVALFWGDGIIETAPGRALLDAAGNIVVPLAGQAYDMSSTRGMLVARFTSAGALDTSGFAGTGFAFNNDAGSCDETAANALALDSAGRIAVAGTCTSASGTAFAVERLRGDSGALDTSFGISGWSLGDYVATNDNNSGFAIAFDSSGHPLVGGSSYATGGLVQMAGVARLTYDLIHTNNFEAAPRGCLSPNCN